MKTQQTIDEVRLVYRTKVRASERLQVKCSKDAFDIFMEDWDQDSIEHIKELCLSHRAPENMTNSSVLLPDHNELLKSSENNPINGSHFGN